MNKINNYLDRAKIARFLFFTLFFISCDFKNKALNPKDTVKKEIRMYLGEAPLTLDWQKSREALSGTISLNIMEGFYKYDFSKKRVITKPALLKTVKTTDNYKVWQLCLKKNIQWSDGQKLTTNHFLKAWFRFLSPDTASPQVHHFLDIVKAKEFYQGKAKAKEVGIRSISDHCLEVRLNRPSPLFDKILSSPFSFPLRTENLNERGEIDLTKKDFVTIGPYAIDHDCHGGSLCLKPNPFYHQKIPENKLVILFLDNETTALKLFEKNELDLVRLQSNDQNIGSNQSQLIHISSLGITFLGFNLKNSLAKNLDFRKLIQQTIDLKELEKVFNEKIKTVKSLYPTLDSHLDINSDSKSNVKSETRSTKKQTITALSHSMSESGLNSREVSLASNSTPFNKTLLENISYQIKSKTQLNVSVQLMDSASYFNQLLSNDTNPIFRMTWTPAIIDPYGYLSLFQTQSGTNFFGYQNSSFDKTLQLAYTETDPKKRELLYQKLHHQIIDQDTLVIPLLTRQETLLLKKNLHCSKLNPLERFDFSACFIKK